MNAKVGYAAGIGIGLVFALGIVTHTLATTELRWGPLRLTLGGPPKVLPSKDLTPISFLATGNVNLGSATPPILKKVTVNLDKNGAFDTSGIPACQRERLLNAKSGSDARSHCQQSILGSGQAHVGFMPQGRNPVLIPLTIFNGGNRKGSSTIFVQGSLPESSDESVVVPIEIQPIHDRRYGLKAVATVPEIAGGNGVVLDFSFKIDRSIRSKGHAQSVVEARCADGYLKAESPAFVFSNGEEFRGRTFLKSCTPVNGR